MWCIKSYLISQESYDILYTHVYIHFQVEFLDFKKSYKMYKILSKLIGSYASYKITQDLIKFLAGPDIYAIHKILHP